MQRHNGYVLRGRRNRIRPIAFFLDAARRERRSVQGVARTPAPWALKSVTV